jgi:hypothetical protein
VQTLTINADHPIARQIMAAQEQERLETRAEQARTLTRSQAAIEKMGPNLRARMQAAEKAVRDAEAALDAARTNVMSVSAAVQAEAHPHEIAVMRAEMALRNTASPQIAAFRKEMQELLGSNTPTVEYHHEHPRMRRSNGAALQKRNVAVRSAMDAARALELLALDEAAITQRLLKLRQSTEVPFSVFGSWFEV